MASLKIRGAIVLSRLFLLRHYMRVLGTWTGFRYWRISNRCITEPDLVLSWAERCQSDASKYLAHGDEKRAHWLLDWAESLRDSHARYMGHERRRKHGVKRKIRVASAKSKNGSIKTAADRTERILGHSSAKNFKAWAEKQHNSS